MSNKPNDSSGPVKRKRSNVFSRHPHGDRILTQLINKEITQTAAAKQLGCTSPNIHYYLKNHLRLKPSKAEKKAVHTPSPTEEARLTLSQLQEYTVKVDGQTPLELMGTVAWRTLEHLLLAQVNSKQLDLPQLLSVSQELRRLIEFQTRYGMPDIPAEKIEIDEKMAKEIIDSMWNDHDKWCPYRQQFIERKDKTQSKARMESKQSTHLG